jgi:hypothetical protein
MNGQRCVTKGNHNMLLMLRYRQLYYAFSAMFGWSTFSFATISSVQNQSYSLRWKFAKLFGSDDDSLPDLLNSIHKYASAMQISPDPDEDASPYPCESTSPAGMGLEFRYGFHV